MLCLIKLNVVNGATHLTVLFCLVNTVDQFVLCWISLGPLVAQYYALTLAFTLVAFLPCVGNYLRDISARVPTVIVSFYLPSLLPTNLYRLDIHATLVSRGLIDLSVRLVSYPAW